MSTPLLIIAILINGTAVTQYAFPVKGDCEEVARHAAVVGTYRDELGKDVILYCVEGR